MLIMGNPSGGPPPSNSTWSPTLKYSSIVLSNSNYTATANEATWRTVLLTTTKLTGKWYFETYVRSDNGWGWIFGLANPSIRLDTYLGCDINGRGFQLYGGGNVYYTYFLAGDSGTIDAAWSGSSGTGDFVAAAVDLNARTCWFRNVTRGSGWTHYGSGSMDADPATGLYGMPIPSGAISPAWSGYSENPGGDIEMATFINKAPFAGTPPTGFTGWDG
jgi:hypothetical protein